MADNDPQPVKKSPALAEVEADAKRITLKRLRDQQEEAEYAASKKMDVTTPRDTTPSNSKNEELRAEDSAKQVAKLEASVKENADKFGPGSNAAEDKPSVKEARKIIGDEKGKN
jgi:hypothetical protein